MNNHLDVWVTKSYATIKANLDLYSNLNTGINNVRNRSSDRLVVHLVQ